MAKLYCIYGTMNSGKTTALLQVAHNYQERRMRTAILCPDLVLSDCSADGLGGTLRSRVGISAPAYRFSSDSDLFEMVTSENMLTGTHIACVLVDEAQFLTKTQVGQLARVVDDLNIPVLAYGLRTDFRGELFAGSAALLAVADSVTEIKTICAAAACGKKATMHLRISSTGAVERDGEQVEIGDVGRYYSVCRRHWKDAIQSGKWP